MYCITSSKYMTKGNCAQSIDQSPFPHCPFPSTIKHNSYWAPGSPLQPQFNPGDSHKHVKWVLKSVCWRFSIVHRDNTCFVWITWSCDLFVYIFEHMQCSCIHCSQRSRFIEPTDLCSNLFQMVQKPDYWQNYSHEIIKTWLYREQIFWMEDLWSMKVWFWWLSHLTWLEVKSRLPIWSEALLGWLKLLPRFISIGIIGLRIGSANYYPSRELFIFKVRGPKPMCIFSRYFQPIAITDQFHDSCPS